MTQDKGTYMVACHHCQAAFDALDAAWCSCLVTERSVACPACLSCSCGAPAEYKSRFWSSAPRALWDRKFGEHHSEAVAWTNRPPEELPRPLVLLAEDEPDIRRVATRVIASLGYGLVVAKNGAEGLELARAYRPDLVLTDALMPRMDGREMARAIKADRDLAATKVVVMTSLYTKPSHVLDARRNVGVDDYLAKPVDFGLLRGLLQKHLG